MQLTLSSLITIAFCIVIIGLLVYAGVRVRKVSAKVNGDLRRISKSSKDEIEKISPGSLKVADDALRDYLKTVQHVSSASPGDRSDGDGRTIRATRHTADEFFHTEELLAVGKSSPGLLAASPSILVGIGILGTFAGLALGVSGFETGSTEQIKTSIDMLLGGMSTAFASSLFGMFGSLVLTAVERSNLDNVYRNVQRATHRLDRLFLITRDQEIEIALQQQRKLLVQSLKGEEGQPGILAELHAQRTDQLTGIVRELNASLVASAAQGDVKHTTADLLREIYTESRKQTAALESFSRDMAEAIMRGMEALLDVEQGGTLGKALDNLRNDINTMVDKLADPAADMTQGIAAQLETAMQSLVAEFKDNLSGSAKEEMEALSNQLASAGQALSSLPAVVADMSSNLQDRFNTLGHVVEQAGASAASRTQSANEEMAVQMDTFAAFIKERLDEMAAQSAKLNSTSTARIEETERLLTRIQTHLNEFERATRDLTGLSATFSQANLEFRNTGAILQSSSKAVDESGRRLAGAQDRQTALATEAEQRLDKAIRELNSLVEATNQLGEHTATRYAEVNAHLNQAADRIRDGFKEYTDHVSSSTGEFMKSYSASLTEATTALSSAGQQYVTVAETLQESIDMLQRRG